MEHRPLTRRAFLAGHAFRSHEGGATAIEYGLLAGIVSLASVVALQRSGGAVGQRMDCAARTIGKSEGCDG